jgi:peptidoglycan-N-acetylglucosamine deacetylase
MRLEVRGLMVAVTVGSGLAMVGQPSPGYSQSANAPLSLAPAASQIAQADAPAADPLLPKAPVKKAPTKPVVKPATAATPGAPKVAKSTVAKVPPAAKKAVSLAALTAQETVPPHQHESIPVPPSECPGNPDAIGLSRIIKVDTSGGFYVGQTYHTRMPLLEPKEVILTFDDGPLPARTDRVLAALKHECVKATFFMVGQMAKAYPAEARKVALEGHTIAYHTMTHTYQLKSWPLEKSQEEIRNGWQAVDQAVYGKAGPTPATVFFRYPGLFNSHVVNDWFNHINMGVFAIDAAGNDWLKGHLTAAEAPNVMNEALKELEAQNGGILLLHDIKESSSNAVAPLLRELKKRGFKIVHIEPKVAPPPIATGPAPEGVIDTTPAPLGERNITGFDVGRQLAQDKQGKVGKPSDAATPLPAYQVQPAAPAAKPAQKPGTPLIDQPADPTVTKSIPASPSTDATPAPKPVAKDEGWFSSTASSFRSVASAIGLW